MLLERLRDFYRRPRELRAVELLRHPESYPGLAPWSELDTLVSFIRLPSFHPYSVWTFQRCGEDWRVRRIEWDHVADHRDADSVPESAPTTYGADAQLPASDSQQLLDNLTAIRLPPLNKRGAWGIDGVSYSVVFGNAWASACLSWWVEPPEGWQPLAQCYERAIDLFEHHLPVSTAGNPKLHAGA